MTAPLASVQCMEHALGVWKKTGVVFATKATLEFPVIRYTLCSHCACQFKHTIFQSSLGFSLPVTWIFPDWVPIGKIFSQSGVR